LIVTHADFANLSLLGGPLRRLIKSATVVASDAVPPDVVTMNSRVVLAYETTGVRRVVTLVYPLDARAALDQVSVLEPLGMALLGARAGQRVGESLRVVEVAHQPERHLRERLVTRSHD
jgi:regulator of nucleoside diphosphate kinase